MSSGRPDALEKLPAGSVRHRREFAEALKDKTYGLHRGDAAPRPAGRLRRAARAGRRRLGVLVPALCVALAATARSPSGAGSAGAGALLRPVQSRASRRIRRWQPPFAGGGARIALSADGRALA